MNIFNAPNQKDANIPVMNATGCAQFEYPFISRIITIMISKTNIEKVRTKNPTISKVFQILSFCILVNVFFCDFF